ncbi:hypothetical protein KC365_g85 [Hortaea werneckii]|nr:hypothetical protein KC365_g85 [Hortaea werneckii]
MGTSRSNRPSPCIDVDRVMAIAAKVDSDCVNRYSRAIRGSSCLPQHHLRGARFLNVWHPPAPSLPNFRTAGAGPPPHLAVDLPPAEQTEKFPSLI